MKKKDHHNEPTQEKRWFILLFLMNIYHSNSLLLLLQDPYLPHLSWTWLVGVGWEGGHSCTWEGGSLWILRINIVECGDGTISLVWRVEPIHILLISHDLDHITSNHTSKTYRFCSLFLPFVCITWILTNLKDRHWSDRLQFAFAWLSEPIARRRSRRRKKKKRKLVNI